MANGFLEHSPNERVLRISESSATLRVLPVGFFPAVPRHPWVGGHIDISGEDDEKHLFILRKSAAVFENRTSALRRTTMKRSGAIQRTFNIRTNSIAVNVGLLENPLLTAVRNESPTCLPDGHFVAHSVDMKLSPRGIQTLPRRTRQPVATTLVR